MLRWERSWHHQPGQHPGVGDTQSQPQGTGHVRGGHCWDCTGAAGVWGVWGGKGVRDGAKNLSCLCQVQTWSLNKTSRSSSNASAVCQMQRGAGDDSGEEENTKTQALSIDVRVKVGRWSAEYFYPNRGVICLSPMKCWEGVLSTQFMQRENSPSHS